MMKQKLLIVGATGMAGHMIYHYLHETGKYALSNAVYRTRLTPDSIVVDVSDPKAVAALIRRTAPDVVVNCVGVLIRGSKQQPDNAVLLNAYFPHLLARLCGENGAKLIHISTDCVFSGRKGNYTEADFRDADDVYGRSKALGEVDDAANLTIRTSIIGPELKENGEGLFHWFMHQTGPVDGFTTAVWGGVTTLELARAIDYALLKGTTGLVQLGNGEGITKYELLRLFQQIWQKTDVRIRPFDGQRTDKSIARSARFDYEVPAYSDMLVDLRQWMASHKSLYAKNYSLRGVQTPEQVIPLSAKHNLSNAYENID